MRVRKSDIYCRNDGETQARGAIFRQISVLTSRRQRYTLWGRPFSITLPAKGGILLITDCLPPFFGANPDGSGRLTVYHASETIVENPVWDYAELGIVKRRDFGAGFYTSPSDDYPKRLYSDKDTVFVNRYSLDTSGLKIKTFQEDTEWLLTVAFGRRDFNSRRYKISDEIREKYRNMCNDCDIVVGRIFDDLFFSAMEFFLRGAITDYVALKIALEIPFGHQIVLKSSKACSQLSFEGAQQVPEEEILAIRADAQKLNMRMEDIKQSVIDKYRNNDPGKSIFQLLQDGAI